MSLSCLSMATALVVIPRQKVLKKRLGGRAEGKCREVRFGSWIRAAVIKGRCVTIHGRKLSFKIADGGSIDSVERGKLTKLSSSLRSMSEQRFSQVCSAVDGTIFPRLGVCLECRALSSVAKVTSFDGTLPTSRELKSCCIEMQPATYSANLDWYVPPFYAASSLGTVQYLYTKSSKTEFWGRVPLPRTYVSTQ